MTGPDGRRALLLTKTDPAAPRDGGALRVAAVIAALHGDGWHVDVVAARTAAGRRRTGLPRPTGAADLAAAARVAASALRIGSLSVARWADPRVAAEVARLRRRHAYDLAVVEFSQLLVHRPLLAGLPVLLDMHNLEAELLANYAGSAPTRLRRAAARWEAARVRALESARSLRGVDGIVTVSGRDAAHVDALLGPGAAVTASNGVADEAFAVRKHRAEPPVVVFVAHLGWQPNVDAARWLAERVWPVVRAVRPDAVLRLVGRSPAPAVRALHGRDGIEVHPDVPSTLPHLAAASVATAPLLAAGGTRLKILEALATGTPVVATPLGALGLAHLSAGLAVEEAPEPFARAVLARLDAAEDPGPLRAVAEDYRWARALRPLLGAAAALADRGGSAAASTQAPTGGPAAAGRTPAP